MRTSRSFSIPVVAVGLALLASEPARALTIPIDPGAVGTIHSPEFNAAFPELDGTVYSGQTLSLHFVFSDMKHLELHFLSAPDLFASAAVILSHDGGVEQITSISGYLFDELGAPILSASSPAGSAGGGVSAARLEFLSGAFDGLVFHGVHFEFNLPNTGSVVSSAVLQVEGFSVDPFEFIEIEVGEWESVPEPSVALLFAVSLLALGAGLRRRLSAV
jgi:hypothetical protein